MGGRKQAGERYPCGRLKRPARSTRPEDETALVLSQPHRRGERSQMAESELGRFCLERRLGVEVYDAALRYGQLRRKIASVWGGPKMEHAEATGGDTPIEAVLRWMELALALEQAMVDAGGPLGKAGVSWLVMNEKALPPGEATEQTKRALCGLANYRGSRSGGR